MITADYRDDCRRLAEDAQRARLYRPNMSRREREEDRALDREFGFEENNNEEGE